MIARSMLALGVLTLAGCGLSGDSFRPELTDVPSIIDLGELPVIDQDTWSASDFDPTDPASGVVYAQVGADVNPAKIGGATFTFSGTNHTVCVVMDPENIFWNVGLSGDPGTYKYQDKYTDDGDMDLDVGLTAYYSGSPGSEIGDFNAVYSDPSGVDHTLAFNECFQAGYNGDSVHAGRGAVESCEIDTRERAHISYTGAIKTFVLPIDDSIGNFAIGIFDVGDGKCSNLKVSGEDGATECTFPNETNMGAPWDYSDLEAAYCKGSAAVNSYCKDHLGDDDPPCFEPSDAALGTQADVPTDTGG